MRRIIDEETKYVWPPKPSDQPTQYLASTNSKISQQVFGLLSLLFSILGAAEFILAAGYLTVGLRLVPDFWLNWSRSATIVLHYAWVPMILTGIICGLLSRRSLIGKLGLLIASPILFMAFPVLVEVILRSILGVKQ